jgi:4-diphosphocytidyl-2-C-methyl-D-erythritol kinase
VRTAPAFAKINLALVAGPLRPDGKHEVATVLQAVDLHDDVGVERSAEHGVSVEGFPDTIVRHALTDFIDASDFGAGLHVRLEKRIPVAAGLGGGSSDAATALLLANALAPAPLSSERLHEIAAGVGADVPFFLDGGTQLGAGDGSELSALSLPLDFWIVLSLPDGEAKESTASVYSRFDERSGSHGFEERRRALLESLAAMESVLDLARLPRNDLASSPLAAELEGLGACRADVSGAGPCVYGIFERQDAAQRAVDALRARGWTCLVGPQPAA